MCRRPEIPTNHTENEGGRKRERAGETHDSRSTHVITNYGGESRTYERASERVYTQVRRRRSGAARSEATEEAEDLSRRQFGLTDLIRLGRGRCDASPGRRSGCRLRFVATTSTTGRLHCARHLSRLVVSSLAEQIESYRRS